MTHHSFTTSLELLDALIKRYSITPPYGLNQKSFENFVNQNIVPIRLRVCNSIKHWIDNYYEGDFVQNGMLVQKTVDFITNKIMHDFSQMGKTLLRMLKDKQFVV